MTDSTNLLNKTKNNSWIYKLFLYASFIWINIYEIAGIAVSNFQFGFGNLLSTQNINFSYVVFMIMIYSLLSWIVFEFLLYLYYSILSRKIYSYILPLETLKAECRLYFTFRNLVLGIFVNLCFIAPYLHMYMPMLSVLISFSFVILFALHINKTYAEPIIGHFVFKNFCYPAFVLEILVLIFKVLEVLIW